MIRRRKNKIPTTKPSTQDILNEKEEKAANETNKLLKIVLYLDCLAWLKSQLEPTRPEVKSEFFQENYLRIGVIVAVLHLKVGNCVDALKILSDVNGTLSLEKITNDDIKAKSRNTQKYISQVFHYLGNLNERKKYDTAIAYYERSISIKSNLSDKNKKEIAQERLKLGHMAYLCNKDEMAIENIKEANSFLQFSKNSTKENFQEYYSALKILVEFYSKRNDSESSSLYLHQMVEIATKFASEQEASFLLYQIGRIQFQKGHFRDALSTLERSLDVKQSNQIGMDT